MREQVIEHRVADEGVSEDVLAGVDLSDQAGCDRRVEGVDGGIEVGVEHPTDDPLVEHETGHGGGIQRRRPRAPAARRREMTPRTPCGTPRRRARVSSPRRRPASARTPRPRGGRAAAARKNGLPSVCSAQLRAEIRRAVLSPARNATSSATSPSSRPPTSMISIGRRYRDHRAVRRDALPESPTSQRRQEGDARDGLRAR